MANLVWVDSRVKGVGKSWYYGGADQMTLDELQQAIDEHNACVFYNDIFYDNVKDIPLVKELRYIEEFGMPTNLTISTDPTVTVVPKGTTLYIGYCSRRFVFPKVEE